MVQQATNWGKGGQLEAVDRRTTAQHFDSSKVTRAQETNLSVCALCLCYIRKGQKVRSAHKASGNIRCHDDCYRHQQG